MYEKFADQLAARTTMRGRLLKERRDQLVTLCIRHAGLCAEARRTLRPEHFSLPGERPHQLIIRHLWKLLDGGLYAAGAVPYAALYDSIAEELVGYRPKDLQEAWIGEAIDDPSQPGWEGAQPGLLRVAYDADMAAFDRSYAFETLRLFLEERAVADTAAALVASMGARVPLDYTQKLKDILDSAQRIEVIGDSPISLPMPDGWAPRPLTPFPSGCPWVDHKLDGQVPGDVNGLIGTYGGGKTTGLTQLTVMTGRYFLRESMETGRKPRVAFMVSYEEPEDAIRPRVLSCASRVSKTTLEQMTDFGVLTRRGHLKDYEITMYRQEGEEDFQNLDGEYERLMTAADEINQSVRIVDMRSGGRGAGWIDELAGFLARFREENEVEVGLVCIDYVNAMCRRHVDSLPKVRDSTLRDNIQKTPLQAEEKIARRFNCPVWLAQQFSGEANKKAPGTKMMMADASEARSFGENLIYCLAFGVADPATKCIQLTYVKSRRRGIQGDSMLVRMEGDLARIVPAGELYVVEGGKIVDKRIRDQFTGAVAPPRSPLYGVGAQIGGENIIPWHL
jgi:hypothetical protein